MVIGMGARDPDTAAVGLKPPPRGWQLLANVLATLAGRVEASGRAATSVGGGAGILQGWPSMMAEVENRLEQVGRVALQAILLLHILALCSETPRRLVAWVHRFAMRFLRSLRVG